MVPEAVWLAPDVAQELYRRVRQMPEPGLLETALDVITPDWLYEYDWQSPAGELTGELGKAAGVAEDIGRGWFGGLGTRAGGARYVTQVQRINPDGSVDTVDVFKGKPYLTRQDLATVRKVKKCAAKLKRWFPSARRNGPYRRTKAYVKKR